MSGIEAVTTERIGSKLAQQSTNVKGAEGGMMFDGRGLPPVSSNTAERFNGMVNAEIASAQMGGIAGGLNRLRLGRRRSLPLVRRIDTPSGGVVRAIQSVRDKFLEIQHRVTVLCSKGTDFSSVDLMRMQYDVMQLAYLNELSSKTADKTSQGLQTLFRNQG
jgi:outer membrane lipoprotein SlyB